MSDAEEAYGQGHASSVVRSQHWRNVSNSAAYLTSDLRPGHDVLDIGCGPGTITVDIAARVTPGRVLGVDPSVEVLAQARANAETAGVDNTRFETGDVYALGVDAESYDVVHAHQVMLHLADPPAALREMMRVVRTGGVVAARDSDYGGMIWYPEDPRLDRWLEIYRAVGRGNGSEPDAGRRLQAWANDAGAKDVTPSASIWCHSTPAERAWWGGMWADRILYSRIAEQATEGGYATRAELEEISTAWREWVEQAGGWFAIPHGEILIRV